MREKQLEIARQNLDQSEQAWKPYENMDFQYNKWMELPWWKQIFKRRPSIINGLEKIIAAENIKYARKIVEAFESGDECLIDSLRNDPLFPKS